MYLAAENSPTSAHCSAQAFAMLPLVCVLTLGAPSPLFPVLVHESDLGHKVRAEPSRTLCCSLSPGVLGHSILLTTRLWLPAQMSTASALAKCCICKLNDDRAKLVMWSTKKHAVDFCLQDATTKNPKCEDTCPQGFTAMPSKQGDCKETNLEPGETCHKKGTSCNNWKTTDLKNQPKRSELCSAVQEELDKAPACPALKGDESVFASLSYKMKSAQDREVGMPISPKIWDCFAAVMKVTPGNSGNTNGCGMDDQAYFLEDVERWRNSNSKYSATG